MIWNSLKVIDMIPWLPEIVFSDHVCTETSISHVSWTLFSRDTCIGHRPNIHTEF